MKIKRLSTKIDEVFSSQSKLNNEFYNDISKLKYEIRELKYSLEKHEWMRKNPSTYKIGDMYDCKHIVVEVNVIDLCRGMEYEYICVNINNGKRVTFSDTDK